MPGCTLLQPAAYCSLLVACCPLPTLPRPAHCHPSLLPTAPPPSASSPLPYALEPVGGKRMETLEEEERLEKHLSRRVRLDYLGEAKWRVLQVGMGGHGGGMGVAWGGLVWHAVAGAAWRKKILSTFAKSAFIASSTLVVENTPYIASRNAMCCLLAPKVAENIASVVHSFDASYSRNELCRDHDREVCMYSSAYCYLC